MHGQDAPVQHVWVGNQQLRSLTRFTTVSLQGSHVRTRSKARGRGGGGLRGGLKPCGRVSFMNCAGLHEQVCHTKAGTQFFVCAATAPGPARQYPAA